MSTQITTAFVNQYSQNVSLLSQQMGSLLRNSVRTETVNGEKGFFEQIGSGVAQARSSRHSDTPLMDTPHARRMVTMTDYEYADLLTIKTKSECWYRQSLPMLKQRQRLSAELWMMKSSQL